MSRFTCLGPLIDEKDKMTVRGTVRVGCGESLDAVIEAAEKEVLSGKRKPGMQELVCPCQKKRKFSACIEPVTKANA